MKEAMSLFDIVDGMATFLSNMFLVFLIIAVFFVGVTACACFVIWDTYESSICACAVKVKNFFTEHIWRIASIF